MKSIICILALILVVGCRTEPGTLVDTRGGIIGSGTWQEVNEEDAKLILPRQFSVSKRIGRSLSDNDTYQEQVVAIRNRISYVIQLLYSGSGSYTLSISAAEFRAAFKGLARFGASISISDLNPVWRKDVFVASFQHNSKDCVAFYRVLGGKIWAAGGMDGPAHITGLACGSSPAGSQSVIDDSVSEIDEIKLKK